MSTVPHPSAKPLRASCATLRLKWVESGSETKFERGSQRQSEHSSRQYSMSKVSGFIRQTKYKSELPKAGMLCICRKARTDWNSADMYAHMDC